MITHTSLKQGMPVQKADTREAVLVEPGAGGLHPYTAGPPYPDRVL